MQEITASKHLQVKRLISSAKLMVGKSMSSAELLISVPLYPYLRLRSFTTAGTSSPARSLRQRPLVRPLKGQVEQEDESQVGRQVAGGRKL